MTEILATPAATVVVLRDGPRGPETLLLHRSSASNFGAGALVFPGGRVEPEDWAGIADGDDLAVARVAAVRETAEEAGLVLDPAALVPFAWWCPPPSAPTRFATYFFACAADGIVEVDGAEIVDHVWLPPTEALEQHALGSIDLMAPTYVTLAQLAAHDSIASFLAAAPSPDELPRHMSNIVEVEGGTVLLWQGDAGYESGDADAVGGRRRLWMLGKPWRYEESPASSG